MTASRYPDVIDETSTLKRAIKGASLARYGDGEIKLALRRNAKSQRYEPDLGSALRKILKEGARGGPCLPCIPRIAHQKSPKETFWRQYRTGRVVGLYDTSRKATYGSAFVTRPDSAYPNIERPDYWEMVRSIWADRDVIVVHGSTKSLHGDYLPGAGKVEAILAPRQHAWAAAPELFQKLKAERSRPVLMCLGATATVLAWRLAHEGVHALDLGHIGMFMKKEKPGETSDPD